MYTDERFGSFGLLLSRFGVSEIDGRDMYGNPTGSFDDSEVSLAFGYGREVMPSLGVGGSVKYISHSLGESGASGFGVDLGVHGGIEVESEYVERVRLGLSVSNLGASLEWDTASSHVDDVPVGLRMGAGFDMRVMGVGILLALEGSKVSEESFEFRGGLESWVYRGVALRAGVDGGDLAFGMSVEHNQFHFDYGLSTDVLEEGATNKIGLRASF